VPEIPPSARELSLLLKTIREKKVKALFTEPGERSRLAQRIAKDSGIKLGVLDPLETGELKPDSYERGMRKNAAALLEDLR
jgi:ABC-type Zn uptake system ZnuABC Zn-binding protein ZnuA